MNQAALKIKEITSSSRPVAICNGDVLFIDIVAEECKDIDIYGTNMYRGKTFTDAFTTVKEKLDMPIMMTEFGAEVQSQVLVLAETMARIEQRFPLRPSPSPAVVVSFLAPQLRSTLGA